jgi:hypothetical protein
MMEVPMGLSSLLVEFGILLDTNKPENKPKTNFTVERQLKRGPKAATPVEKNQPKSIDDKDRDTALELAKEVGAKTPIAKLMENLDLKKVYEALNDIRFK